MKADKKSNEEKRVQIVKVTRESGIPLMGHIAFGILERADSNMIQIRATTLCNMKCEFCSTSANDFSMHPVDYVVNIDYLLDWAKEVIKIKGSKTQVFLDSVGDPLMHPDFVRLVEGLRKIPEVSEIIVITNGTLLSKEKIDALEKAGLTRINISIHSLEKKKSKWLFGKKSYDIERVIENIKEAAKSKIKVMLTPVLLQGVNEEDVEKIIQFAKDNRCLIGIQNYEIYKYGRKMNNVKIANYWKFYKKMEEWEKKYGSALKLKKEEFGLEKNLRMKPKFRIGERVLAEIVAPGWLKNQMIAAARDRCITVSNCTRNIKDKVKIRLTETKNNIYLAEMV